MKEMNEETAKFLIRDPTEFLGYVHRPVFQELEHVLDDGRSPEAQ
jgi:hypothetical protein